MDGSSYHARAELKRAYRMERKRMLFARLPFRVRLWRAIKAAFNELRGRG